MSGSGLIYAAIAILWAAVLIPMWLRNHDAATENRSAERFGQAMRVLSRKDAGSGRSEDSGDTQVGEHAEPRVERAPQREAVRPARRTAATRVTAKARPKDRAKSRPKDRRRQPQRPPLTLAQRRARTLGVLSGLAFVVAVVAVGTPLPWWTVIPFAALLCAFVVHLRIQAKQKHLRQRMRSRGDVATQPSRRTASADVEETASSRRHDAESVSRSTGMTDVPESTSETGVVQGPSRAVVVERKGETAVTDTAASETAASETAASESSMSDDDDAWRPNPLPLPTYVTAPKAVRPIKVIDLTTPGAWTSGRLLDDGLAEEDLLAAQVAEEELDALLDQEVAPSSSDGADSADADEQKRRAVGD
ncbi:MAG TPA: hypothetical protein VFX15_11090 [Actinomycetes bacterium]|nr:hypothetical protein [Actinomycetes bacterium]